jgi:hypothetical protein
LLIESGHAAVASRRHPCGATVDRLVQLRSIRSLKSEGTPRHAYIKAEHKTAGG